MNFDVKVENVCKNKAILDRITYFFSKNCIFGAKIDT